MVMRVSSDVCDRRRAATAIGVPVSSSGVRPQQQQVKVLRSIVRGGGTEEEEEEEK